MTPEIPKLPLRAVSEALPNKVSLENTRLLNRSDALLDFDTNNPVVISDYEPFQNVFGAVRLKPVRNHFWFIADVF
ncbi:unnamed protein product [marine sediment metagenome]|uniref:Uncharacterized protein n=1 Tax=marine sediment metagenome TaxID=412755 RepID=X1HBZ3_9ZZZZ